MIKSLKKVIRAPYDIEKLVHKNILKLYDENRLDQFSFFFSAINFTEDSAEDSGLTLISTAAEIATKTLMRLNDGQKFVKFLANLFKIYFSSPMFRKSLCDDVSCTNELELFEYKILPHINHPLVQKDSIVSQHLSDLCKAMIISDDFKTLALRNVANDYFLASLLLRNKSNDYVNWIETSSRQIVREASVRLTNESEDPKTRLAAWNLIKTVWEYGDLLDESLSNSILKTLANVLESENSIVSIDDFCDLMDSVSNNVWEMEFLHEIVLKLLRMDAEGKGKYVALKFAYVLMTIYFSFFSRAIDLETML